MVDNTERGIILDGFRSIMAGLDRVVYNLLSVIYEIFFNVATANIISGQTVKTFYSRVQLILGVVIMFKVAISLFNGIMNPDSLNDGKNGFSSIIKRVVMVLIMFVLMVPLNIPNAGNSDDYTSNSQSSWNARMNENGILFGTLYEVQSRLLSQNIVSKLILGTDYSASNDEDDDPNSVSNFANDTLHLNVNENEYEKAARQLSSIVLRCFVTINLESEYGDPAEDDDRMCKEDSEPKLENYDKSYAVYEDDDSTASEILAEINQMCDIETGYGGERYAYNYLFGFSTIVGILFVIIIVSFTVDAAIRVFKLAILRLIAPIPIISYIDPKTESTFQNWVKILGKTFADLFVRLAIINFVIFFIREFGTNSLGVTVAGNGLVGVFSKIFIYLGLLMFAKEAPKFIADSLGIKDTGKFKLFGGLGRLHATGSMLAGTVGSAATNWRAFRQEQPKREDVLQHPIAARASNFFRRGVGAAGSALIGGAGGLITGANALSGAESDFNKNVVRAQQNRNAQRASHSTMIGRFNDRQAQLWTGQSLADRDKQALDANIKAKEAIGNFKKRAQEEARKNSNITGSVNIQGPNGTTRSVVANYEKLIAAMGAKDSSGNFTYNGGQYNVSDFDTNVLNELLKSQTNTYLSNPNNAKSVEADFKALQSAVNSSSFARDVSSYITNASTAFDNSGTLMGKAAGAVADYQYDMTHVKHMANKQANDSK